MAEINKVRKVKVVAQWSRASEVESKPIDWLWPDYFARGKVSMLVGDPGLGKSLVALFFAARVTRGDEWPGGYEGSGKSASVVLLSAEDDASDTIVPRAEAAGVDLSKLHIMGLVEQSGFTFNGKQLLEPIERDFDLATDLPLLRAKLKSLRDVGLVIIDPLPAYQPGINSDKNSEVRASLNGLKRLAEEFNVSVVAIMHLNKSQIPAIYRVSGSMGYVAMARAVFLVSQNPKSIDSLSRLFLPMKNNLGPPSNGLSFELIPQVTSIGIEIMAVEFGGLVKDVSVDDALALPKPKSTSTGGERLGFAVDFLRTTLGAGAKPTMDVEEAAKANGIAKATLLRARRELGIRTYKGKGSLNGRWFLELPLAATAGAKGEDDASREDRPGRRRAFAR